MDNLDNSNHEIYIRACLRTNCIDDKIKKTKLNSLINNCYIMGSLEDILSHLKSGPAKNLVNSFFKYTTNRCDNCNIEKSKIIQLDRAHYNKNNCDRVSLLKKSIQKYYINNITPVKIKDILITFIKLHKGLPLFILCKKCHRNYDMITNK
tara:strand:+ start:450 stop:902 length:453 start_codon:yes stop_codon:yes gene_type:complete